MEAFRQRVSLNVWAFFGIILGAALLAGVGTYYYDQQTISSLQDAQTSAIADKDGQIANLKQQLSDLTKAKTSQTDAQNADIVAATKVVNDFDAAFVKNQTIDKEKALYIYLSTTAQGLRDQFKKANPSLTLNMVGTTTNVTSGTADSPVVDANNITGTAKVTYKDNSTGFARIFRLKKISDKWLINDITGTINNNEVSTISGQTIQ